MVVMQGIFLAGHARPKSKKVVREAIQAGDPVYLEATSLFGNEYEGSVYDAPNGTYYIVGPDPYTSRKFYGQVVVTTGKVVVK
jgi:hypothetical protein